jgi:hypothetical protein
MGLELGGMGLWTYPAKPPDEPYAYILDDERIIRAISNLAGLLIIHLLKAQEVGNTHYAKSSSVTPWAVEGKI